MEPIKTELNDGVFSVRLSRPQVHNAMDQALMEALHSALDEAPKTRARVVVLSGEGNSFCAGADLGYMRQQGEASFAENERSALRLAELFAKIDELPLPVVGKAHGASVGGGVGLMAACDVVVAGESAFFSLAEVRLGLVPAVICPFVVRKVGLSHARDLILSGRKLTAQEALRLGLVHRVVPEAQLDEGVTDVVRDLKAGGPNALSQAKELLRAVEKNHHVDSASLSRITARFIAEARAGEEGRAGTAAFLERKRPPWAAGGST